MPARTKLGCGLVLTVFVLSAPAWADVSHATSVAAKDAAHVSEKVVNKVGHWANEAVKGVQRGVKAAAEGVQVGAKATAHAARKVRDSVDDQSDKTDKGKPGSN